jgi:predicted sulfurtransferase
MKKQSLQVVGIALSAILMVGGSLTAQENENIEQIGVQSLKAQLDSGETMILIDVREDYELEEDGAIEGAIHIPMGELEQRMNDIPKDIRLVFY